MRKWRLKTDGILSKFAVAGGGERSQNYEWKWGQ